MEKVDIPLPPPITAPAPVDAIPSTPAIDSSTPRTRGRPRKITLIPPSTPKAIPPKPLVETLPVLAEMPAVLAPAEAKPIAMVVPAPAPVSLPAVPMVTPMAKRMGRPRKV